MRKLNAARIGVLLLCILLTLPMLTGCANELLEQEQNEQELLEQIDDKWMAIMRKNGSYVSKITVGSYVFKSFFSSNAMVIDEKLICDATQLDYIIGVLDSQKITSFEKMPSEAADLMSYWNAFEGKNVIQIVFLDDDDNVILGANICENKHVVVWQMLTLDNGNMSQVFTHHTTISDQTYQDLESFYINLE